MFIAKLKLAVAVFGILAVAGAGAGSIVHAVLPKISPASSSSSAALEARLHWAPVANGTQRYSASDLRVSVSVKTAGAPPINLVGIDEHGDVLGWYRTAQPKPGGGYTKYGATSFVVARGLFQLFVDVEFVALDGSGHVYALLNPTSGFNDLVYKISPAGRLGKPILLILKGKTTGDPLDSLYGEGQIDISKLMPANLKPNVNIMASDYRGDLLLDGSPSSDQLAYFAICHGRQAVDLHAYDAHMNHKGEIAIALMGKHEFAIYSCATGTERIIPQLTGLVQGGICAFNDNGDILYTTNNGHGVMDYYLISGSRVTKLDLPITVDPNQPLDGLLWMNDRHQIAGRIVLPDKRLHIFVLTPQG